MIMFILFLVPQGSTAAPSDIQELPQVSRKGSFMCIVPFEHRGHSKCCTLRHNNDFKTTQIILNYIK